jgi:mannosyltransferase
VPWWGGVARAPLPGAKAPPARPGASRGWPRRGLAWLAPGLVVLVLAALLAGPQQQARRPSPRRDNLRAVAAIVAVREHPGDAVLYLPASRRVFGLAYPGPFRRLWDVALARPGDRAGSLLGTDVSAQVLRARFTR